MEWGKRGKQVKLKKIRITHRNLIRNLGKCKALKLDWKVWEWYLFINNKFTYKLIVDEEKGTWPTGPISGILNFQSLALSFFLLIVLATPDPASDLFIIMLFLLKLWEPWGQVCFLSVKSQHPVQYPHAAGTHEINVTSTFQACSNTNYYRCSILSGEKFFLVSNLTHFISQKYSPYQVTVSWWAHRILRELSHLIFFFFFMIPSLILCTHTSAIVAPSYKAERERKDWGTEWPRPGNLSK